MSAAKRVRLRWAMIGIVVAVIAVAFWLAETRRGWLSSATARARTLIFGEETEESASGGMEGMPGMAVADSGGEMADPAADVPGYAPVVIEPGLQQRIGTTVGPVEIAPLRMSVEAVGIVRPDETRTARIQVRTDGWVEELFINFVGQRVGKGDPLLSIYSPEFLQAQEEYLVARQSDALQSLGDGRRSLAQMTLQKLRLWDVPAEVLQELERSGQPQVNLTLRSPLSGTVLMKNVLEGDFVTPQRELYMISDLSGVWVQAKVYQYELPHVELGMPATVTIPGIPGARFEGVVVFIQPTVEEATRTVQVRVELPNPRGLLKPDMFVEVEIQHPMGDGLLVPISAVFRTGERDIVFRAESEDRFVPVEVEIGSMKFGEHYHVLQGLETGDRIITSANFLIDSESRLRYGGGGMMPGMDMDMPGGEEMDHAEMKH